MDRALAATVVEASLAKPSSTPCTWREDRDAYLEEKKAELRACLIEPIAVKAVASAWAQQYAGQSSEVKSAFAVARRGESWLLYEPTAQVFARAFGSNAPQGELSLLGFSSKDALAEWLG